MKFSQDFIERVQEANNLVDIISQHTQLKPSGGGFMGRCPFPDHAEKTPSFSVSEVKQVYHCFGCHKSGNIFTFLQQFNGMSFPEAIEFLANRAHIALPQEDERESAKLDVLAQKKKQLAQVNRLACQFFHEQFKRLPQTHHAKVYAEKRGLTAAIIEEFQIGYASDEWDALVQHLQSKGVSMALAEEARLVRPRPSGKSGYYDLFRDRLMFPIFSTMGEPIAFGGRVILQGEPKYLNSPETPVFHKGRVLYGLYQTAKYIRAEDIVLIVEGYMDLVSLYGKDLHYVAATMGTALTADHAKLLSRMTKNVVALFDGDSAGQEAAERSLPLLLAAGLHPKGLILPDNMDPDDFVKKEGADALKALVSEAKDLFSVILARWMNGYRGEASQKIKIVDQVKPLLAAVQDPRLKQLYFQETLQKMGGDEKWLRQALMGASGGVQAGSSQANLKPRLPEIKREAKSGPVLDSSLTQATEEKILLKGASPAERLLLSLALKNRANFEAFDSRDVFASVLHAGVKKLLEKIASTYRQTPEKFDKLASLLIDHVDHPEWLITSEAVLEQSEEEKLLQDCIKKVRLQYLTHQAHQLTLELKASPNPEKVELLTQIQRERLALQQK